MANPHLRTIVAVAFTVVAAGCSGNSSTGPTPSPSPAPAPTPSTFTLSGRVTSSTSGAGINGATVRVQDGANAGRSATTDGAGAYSISGLALAGFTAAASATNYVGTSRGVTLTSNSTADFALAPTPLFTRSGSGNTVFDMPTTVSRIHITGTYTGTFESNFIVMIGGRLVVNDIIGPFRGNSVSDGTYLTTGGTVAITNTTSVNWVFTEVRP